MTSLCSADAEVRSAPVATHLYLTILVGAIKCCQAPQHHWQEVKRILAVLKTLVRKICASERLLLTGAPC